MKHNKESIKDTKLEVVGVQKDYVDVIVHWWTDKEPESIPTKEFSKEILSEYFDRVEQGDKYYVMSDVVIDSDNAKLSFSNIRKCDF